MTLFIACLIIYGLDMNPWLYPLALVAWGIHLTVNWSVVFAAGSSFPASA